MNTYGRAFRTSHVSIWKIIQIQSCITGKNIQIHKYIWKSIQNQSCSHLEMHSDPAMYLCGKTLRSMNTYGRAFRTSHVSMQKSIQIQSCIHMKKHSEPSCIHMEMHSDPVMYPYRKAFRSSHVSIWKTFRFSHLSIWKNMQDICAIQNNMGQKINI